MPFHPQSFDITVSPLFGEFLAALQNPHFMRGGGTLGFFCQHKYTETQKCIETCNCGQLHFLKGKDRIIYQVAQSLGLSITLKPICKGWQGYSLDFDVPKYYILPSFGLKDDDNWYGYDGKTADGLREDDLIRNVFGNDVMGTENIHWCSCEWPDAMKEPILSAAYLYSRHNYSCTVLFYQCAALLVEVPEFTSARGSVTSAEGSPPAKKRKYCQFMRKLAKP